MGEYFDEAEAARRIGVSKATLSRARLRGDVDPIRIGPRVIRYTDDILDEYEQRCPEKVSDILDKALAARVKLKRTPGIYLLYRGDVVVYVGMTTNFTARLANHMFQKQFDSYAFLPSPEDRLLRIEAMLIGALKPELNVLHAVPTKRRTGYVG